MKPQLGVIRRAVRRTMTAACIVEKLDDEPTYDELGTMTYGRTKLYDGPCFVRPVTRDPKHVDVAGTPRTLYDFDVLLPVTANVDAVKLIVTITKSLGDPTLVGREMTVVDNGHDDWMHSRHLGVTLSK